jgi:two-component system sensor histidine kinase/response regulator
MIDLAPVLVVDDRPDNLHAMEALLAELPCRVVAVPSGPEALRSLLHEEFALVLLDVQMPDLDGYETARHIKMRERTRNLPIIFLSAIDTELEHQLRGYDSGAVDFIPKPVRPEVVISKVRVFLELYDQGRRIEQARADLAAQVDQLHRAREALTAQATELARSNAELERFSVAASQELVEPLQLAAGFLTLLDERHAPENEEAQLLLERSRATVSRTLDRIERLLEYAKLSTDSIRLGPVALDPVLEAVVAAVGEELESTGARVTSDPLPTVWGDEWQLRSLLSELIGNALQHGGREQEIHVGLTRRKSRWVVSVHDSGPGCDETLLTAAFDLVHGLTGGVGLARSRRIVERHAGTIWAESAPGVGTSISFSLTPVEESPLTEEGA